MFDVCAGVVVCGNKALFLVLVPVNTKEGLLSCCSLPFHVCAFIITISVNDIFFISSPPSSMEVKLTVDLCVVPDIPMATVGVVTNENGSFCEVETRRGNFRSINVVNSSMAESESMRRKLEGKFRF